ncbi:hypothetical protein BaRGS_00018173 [Batillaria attramentaria]|uniref:Uncharacterized protein n=1 Tax=Batillaria attramentaria TaxID=370345 RepID=A0ABD0KUS4_9CAEN
MFSSASVGDCRNLLRPSPLGGPSFSSATNVHEDEGEIVSAQFVNYLRFDSRCLIFDSLGARSSLKYSTREIERERNFSSVHASRKLQRRENTYDR